MAKKTTIVCDLCDGNTYDDYIELKVRQRWHGFGENGFVSRKIHICLDCVESLKDAARQDRRRREQD